MGNNASLRLAVSTVAKIAIGGGAINAANIECGVSTLDYGGLVTTTVPNAVNLQERLCRE
jgi:hypothetical protein